MFQANQQIGLYYLVRPIGRGGFGEVWLAERRTEILTTQVAIKLPHRDQVNLEAIRQEAELWAKASGHANVLPIIEANIYDGQIVIVSEYAPDGSLEEKVQQEIPMKQTLEIVIGILNGLDFLHARQIIHRDIKPANILLQGETPRLADFGISRVIKTTVLSTSIVGTPKYMAPEAFDGKRTAQTDIWSVGVILYQMLTGNLPYPQDNPTELMWAIVSKEIEQLPNSIPPDLRRIVQKAMVKLPENRFQTAREMREELQRALLSISHPTFAPTEVLEKKPLDNLTIEYKSIVTQIPLTIPEPKTFAPTNLVERTVSQNQPQANIPNEYNPILPTVPAVEPKFQEKPPPNVVQETNLTKEESTTTRIMRWVFYFLAPIIGALTNGIVNNLILQNLFDMLEQAMSFDNSYRWFVGLLISLPVFFIVFGLLGGLLGYNFPREKWRWGVWLNILLGAGNIFFYLTTPMSAFQRIYTPFIFLYILFCSCLGSYLGSWLALRKAKKNV